MSRDGHESLAEGDVWMGIICIDGQFFSEQSIMMFRCPKEAP